MFAQLITGTTEFIGQIVGETAHQTGKAYDAVAEESSETWEAVKNIGDTFSEGYDKELFEPAAREAIADKTKEVAEEVKTTATETVDKAKNLFANN